MVRGKQSAAKARHLFVWWGGKRTRGEKGREEGGVASGKPASQPGREGERGKRGKCVLVWVCGCAYSV